MVQHTGLYNHVPSLQCYNALGIPYCTSSESILGTGVVLSVGTMNQPVSTLYQNGTDMGTETHLPLVMEYHIYIFSILGFIEWFVLFLEP